MFVASPHVGITAPRSSLIASGINWAFIPCSAIRPVRILADFLFLILSSLSLIPISILHHLHLRVLLVFSFHTYFSLCLHLHLLGAQTQNVYSCISLVYIAIHLSITLHMNKYPITHSKFHKLFQLYHLFQVLRIDSE